MHKHLYCVHTQTVLPTIKANITAPSAIKRAHTYHGLEDVLHAFNQLLVDLDGQVADHLSVLCQVEVRQTVLILPRRVVLHEGLCPTDESTKGLKRKHDFGG